MKNNRILWIIGLMLTAVSMGWSQNQVALKTNLLYDALLSPTLGIEVGLKPKWSLDLSGTVNMWTVNEKRWRQWMVQPEARYWFCERFTGNFLALHAIGGEYNFGNLHFGGRNFLGTDLTQLRDHRLQGWMAGAGIGYGYSWLLDRHWNIEAEIGIGWIYTRYDKYKCVGCGKKVNDKPLDHNYYGPTKAAVNLIYVF